jgi:4-hydroxy-2-oxoheptanedioate aldolase
MELGLRKNRLKAALKAGEATVGSWLSVSHPTIGEAMAVAGFDWLIVDMEHGILGLESVQSMVQAIETTPTTPIVRVPWNEPVIVKRVLETGAMSLLFPQVNTAAEALSAVRSANFPPRGIRGIGCGRGAGFGAWFDEYLQKAGDELLIAVQIEHERALENVREIVAVEGIDLVFVGANDLSASMGLLGQPKHPRVLDAIHFVLREAQSAGVAAGLNASDPHDANNRIAEGFQFVGIGQDMMLLSAASRDICSRVERKPAVEGCVAQR